jgi:hypothetical protein
MIRYVVKDRRQLETIFQQYCEKVAPLISFTTVFTQTTKGKFHYKMLAEKI